jgi:hypothetical protein
MKRAMGNRTYRDGMIIIFIVISMYRELVILAILHLYTLLVHISSLHTVEAGSLHTP